MAPVNSGDGGGVKNTSLLVANWSCENRNLPVQARLAVSFHKQRSNGLVFLFVFGLLFVGIFFGKWKLEK